MKLIILFILTMLALIAKDDLKGYRRNQTIDSRTIRHKESVADWGNTTPRALPSSVAKEGCHLVLIV